MSRRRPAPSTGSATQPALRGLDKVTGGACLFALTYNILRFITVSA
jgi:hypothetical protein